ncbi:hypothetical protein AVEN_61569-1 [Araneus ventricosus]|uniref:Uncharacterized protein n=1 Tax=Araneus ventricosus TaxID=182803 RepID=A0A4Y2N400_ARAVE|nr:hypothetical protein AVEN_61569-1 [Araneus ventricosus]
MAFPSFVAVNSSRIKGPDGAIASVHSSVETARLFESSTTVHKYEPRGLSKSHAVGTRLNPLTPKPAVTGHATSILVADFGRLLFRKRGEGIDIFHHL